MKITNYLNKIIELGFYGLFLLTPLLFTSATSELFEFPKMWFVFGVTIIVGTAWIAKMILQRRILIQRTPLDIPLLLFLGANIISAIFSMDLHVSLWGYYSRFNGGLLSVICYLLLYYAYVSNLNSKHTLNILKLSLLSGLIVGLWGIPSHFGYDPTCYVFRGNFDTSCWTDAFKPTIRIFSTMGQPAWLAAYMSILIPICLTYFFINKKLDTQFNTKYQELRSKYKENSKYFILYTLYFILSILFYASLTYTDTRGGFIGFWVANIVFWLLSFRATEGSRGIFSTKLSDIKRSLRSPDVSVGMTMRYFLLFNLTFLLFNFLQGIPISQINKLTLPGILERPTAQTSPTSPTSISSGALGGTDSGKIRLLVWRGAIDAWKDHPWIGTGVETFAYAYYKYKPIEHNLTSEWDYLYNKAHNEYLNYLTTTGIFGLGSYLIIIGVFSGQFLLN